MAAALDDPRMTQSSVPSNNQFSFFPFPRQRDDASVDTHLNSTAHPATVVSSNVPQTVIPATVELSVEADRTLKNLDYLDEAWPLLIELRIPGTRPRWTQRSHRLFGAPGENSTHRGSSTDGTAVGPGGAAPVDLSLLDLIASLATVADDFSHTLAAVLEAPQTAHELPSAWLDPRPHFRYTRARALAADAVDARTIPWLYDQLTPLVVAVSAILGEARHGQVLAALCPWCSGRTDQAPTGGARTLVLRHPDPSAPDLSAARIVCTGTHCEPPKSACSQRDPHGRPAWPWREWDWLATVLLPLPPNTR